MFLLKEDNVWMEEAKLIPNDGNEDDHFGIAVAISEDHVIIGANQDDDNGENSGSAYVFEFENNSWSESNKLHGSTSQMNDEFGRFVSIDGDYAIIGAFLSNDEGLESGSAYIFELEAGNWIEKQKLLSSDLEGGDRFGSSVSINGNKAIVGAYKSDTDVSNSGSAYIYSLEGSVWIEEQKLTNENLIEDDFFGYNVSISENNVIIGAWTDNDGVDSGSAFIFNNVSTNSLTEYRNKSVLLYPNPNNGNFYITNRGEIDRISIYSLDGKIIQENRVISRGKIDFNDLSEGIYFVKITSGDKNEVIKMIIE